jgi:DNA-binding GntR family transcriptional regulator
MNKPKTVAEYVYEEIKNNILIGVFKPGEKLTETSLANDLEVSRTPIRDAIHRLEAEGLVTTTPHKGVTVTKLTKKDVQDFYQTRTVLEGLAAKLAAENATEEELEHFRSTFEKMEEVFEREKDLVNYKDIVKQNNQFHHIICEMAKNDVLVKMIESLRSPINVVRSTAWSSFRERKKETMREHREIADAILDKNGELAKERAEMHIFNAWKTAEKALDENVMEFVSEN